MPPIETTRAAMSPGELAELMRAFNEVTARLEATHDQLRAEVERLTRELSKANEELERSRRLAALGEMAAGISHEVRNPVASIRLFARILIEDLGDRPAERETAAKIERAARTLDAIVGDVLTFARELRVQQTAVRAGELFDAAVECCRSLRGFEGVKVERRAGQTELWADPTLAQQAVTNIVRNAYEALLESGSTPARIVLAAEEVVAPGGGAGQVAISVSDTGPGIPEEALQRIFNPFFTTRASGTGLGLSIVHRIVEAHGGRVSVRNNGDMPPAGRAGVGPNAELACFHPPVGRKTEEMGKAGGRPIAGAPRNRGATVELVFPSGPEGSRGLQGPGVVTVGEGRRGLPRKEAR